MSNNLHTFAVPSYEQIAEGFAELRAHRTSASFMSVGTAVGKMIGMYPMVRPFLVAATFLPFVDQEWRDDLRLFLTTLDAVKSEYDAQFKAGKDLAVADPTSPDFKAGKDL